MAEASGPAMKPDKRFWHPSPATMTVLNKIANFIGQIFVKLWYKFASKAGKG